eukprot:TRINITY_DN13381_c0_g1_i2.p1 TRINITY_DN13381_c0_g1~~TRINITY_DN13381_c0_g1_i2.p1  ORF type:complete len:541 (+),score=100.17 TRINITY_DN13381_c0_g1_i2:130-1623(+)
MDDAVNEVTLELDIDDQFDSDVQNLLQSSRATQREHDKKIEFYLILSRLFAACSYHAWMFFLPLALVAMFPASLTPIALALIPAYAVVPCAAPYLGRLVDTAERLTLINTACLARLLAMGGLTAVLWSMAQVLVDSDGVALLPRSPTQLFADPYPVLLLLCLSCLHALWALSGSAVSIAVEEEWVHAIYPSAFQDRVRTLMRYGERFSGAIMPLAVGVLMEFPPLPDVTLIVFVIIAISICIEYIILRVIHYERPELKARRLHLNDSAFSAESLFGGNPVLVVLRASHTLKRQVWGLLVLCGALLSLGVFAAESATLIAYLGTRSDLTPQTVGLYRCSSMVAVTAASLAAPTLQRRNGALTANRMYVALGVALLLASLLFFFERFYAFLALLVLARGCASGFGACCSLCTDKVVAWQLFLKRCPFFSLFLFCACASVVFAARFDSCITSQWSPLFCGSDWIRFQERRTDRLRDCRARHECASGPLECGRVAALPRGT